MGYQCIIQGLWAFLYTKLVSGLSNATVHSAMVKWSIENHRVDDGLVLELKCGTTSCSATYVCGSQLCSVEYQTPKCATQGTAIAVQKLST